MGKWYIVKEIEEKSDDYGSNGNIGAVCFVLLMLALAKVILTYGAFSPGIMVASALSKLFKLTLPTAAWWVISVVVSIIVAVLCFAAEGKKFWVTYLAIDVVSFIIILFIGFGCSYAGLGFSRDDKKSDQETVKDSGATNSTDNITSTTSSNDYSTDVVASSATNDDYSTESITSSSVVFNSAWIDYNVSQGNKNGMIIHCNFNANDMIGVPCRMCFYFYYSDHKTPLDGNIAKGKNFTPSYDCTSYSDLNVFMPYDKLNLAPGYYNLSVWIMPFYTDHSGNFAQIGYGTFIDFDYNQD